MNVFKQLKLDLKECISKISSNLDINMELLPLDLLALELSKDPAHGDIATNAAMILAKYFSKTPKDLAQLIVFELGKFEYISAIEIAGPGFINIKISNYVWQNIIFDIINQGIKYGESDLGKNIKINLEYVSANPTGPMHIGHARGAIYGDSLGCLLQKVGYDVTREYYINDAGKQISILCESAYLRYKQVCGEIISEIPEGLYPGEYLIEVGEKLYKEFGYELLKIKDSTNFSANLLEKIRYYVIDHMMNLIKSDLSDIGIKHDIFFSEKSLHDSGKIDEIVSYLAQKNLIYNGVLLPPKGQKHDDWEEKEQLLFKATEFGDDSDRTVKKSDGSWTYLAADMAYMKNKIDRGFNHITMIVGADHLGFQKRMDAVAQALSGNKFNELNSNKLNFEMKFCQIVNFLENGQPFKMSKRKGTYVTVQHILEFIDKDILRFVMLTRKNDAYLDFDLKKVTEESKDNPVFYVQYAHARCCSIIKNAEIEIKEAYDRFLNKDFDVTLLSSESEITLLKLMSIWPKLIESAAIHQEPHRLAFYLQDLAAELHALWNKGRDQLELRFLIADNVDLTSARLALAKSVATVIKSGLSILGVNAVDKM